MKFALHRSITFWSGILLMAFICWAWRDSTRTLVETQYRGFAVLHGGSGVSVCSSPEFSRTWRVFRVPIEKAGEGLRQFQAGPPLFLRNTDDAAWDAQWRLPYDNPARDLFLWMQWGSAKGDWQLYIPHWLILLLVAVPWSALLLWRARRRNPGIEKNPHLTPS